MQHKSTPTVTHLAQSHKYTKTYNYKDGRTYTPSNNTHLHTVAESNPMRGYRFPKQKMEFAALWQDDLDINKTIKFYC